MPAPTITELPALPTFPDDAPRVFFPALLAYLAGQGTFRTELMALADYLDGLSVASGGGGSGGTGDMLAENNLADLGDISAALANLGLSFAMPNFTADGEVRIYARTAMTITQLATSGTGSVAYAKSTAAAPSTFNSATSPITLEAGAWLKVTATSVSGTYAVALGR